MDTNLYNMIFKRKSFHLFRNIGDEKITDDEIKDIKEYIGKLKPLCDDIKVKIKIVKDRSNMQTWTRILHFVLFREKRKLSSKYWIYW